MTALRLALSELKRMTSGVMPRIAIIALTIVPLLYGATYLYANWDPQKNVGNLTAALVVEDAGAHDAEGHQRHLGADVAQSLHDADSFTFVDVPSREQATRGVEEGRYSFAVIIPEGFSAALLSVGNVDAGDGPARQGILEVVTNDANNYTVNTFVDKLVTQVHASVAKQVGTEAADQFLSSLGVIHTNLSQAADGAKKLHDGTTKLTSGAADLTRGSKRLQDGAQKLDDGLGTLADGQQQLANGASTLANGTSRLSSGLGTLDSRTSTLAADTQRLANGAQQVADGNAALNQKVQTAITDVRQLDQDARALVVEVTNAMVADGTLTKEQGAKVIARYDEKHNSAAHQAVEQKLTETSQKLQDLADGSQQVADGNQRLASSVPALRQGIVDAHDGAVQLDQGAHRLDDGLGQSLAGIKRLQDGSGQLAEGTRTLHQGATSLWHGSQDLDEGAGTLATKLHDGAQQVPNPSANQRKNLSSVIGDAVHVERTSQASAGNYGAGLAPFFLTLALWVGSFMLVQVLRPISKRALASNARSWRIAIGGWLPFWLISMAQATVLLLVVHFGLGLRTSSLPLTFGFMLLATMAFSAIIQGTVALLGTAGKFVVLVLLVLQLVASGGTMPWELLPGPLHRVHDLLPMSHVVEGMRRLVYGSEVWTVANNAWMLVGYAGIGLAMSVLAAHRHKTWTLTTLQPEIAV